MHVSDRATHLVIAFIYKDVSMKSETYQCESKFNVDIRV